MAKISGPHPLSTYKTILKGFGKMKKKFLALLLSFAVTLSIAVPVAAVSLPEDINLDGAIVILHTNDIHGRVVSSGSQIGFYRLSGLRNLLESQGASVLLFDAGDTLHGLPMATINQGMDIVELMNAVGFDAFTPGNHDFNYGYARLLELSAAMDFPTISANVIVNATGQQAFSSYTIIEVGGISIGVFGLATPDTPIRTNPANVEMLTFTNPLEASRTAVAQLQEAGADIIVALGHVGIDDYSEVTADMIAAQVPGIDIFIDGHSHAPIAHSVPQQDGVTLMPHGDTVIASTAGHMSQVGVIVIQDGEITSLLLGVDDDLPVDESVQAVISELQAAQDVVLSQVVGYTSVLLDGERENVRTGETNLGNLATDAILTATGADLAITNGGGIRASIQAGDITRGDLVTVFPFGNYVITMDVSGATILAALEHSVSAYPNESGGFLQVAGLEFSFNPDAEVGSRVAAAAIGGEALDPDATYVLATNNFLAIGGDGYTMFADYSTSGEFSALEEILIGYIQNNPELVANAAIEGRIVAAEAVPPIAVIALPAELPDGYVVTIEPGTLEVTVVPAPEPIVAVDEPVAAPEPVVVVTDSGVYIVVRGDSLYRIAGSRLGNPNRWGEILDANRSLITDPRVIQPGWELRIPS